MANEPCPVTRPPAFDRPAAQAFAMFEETIDMPRKRRSTAAKKNRETDARLDRQARLERQRARLAVRRSEGQ